MAHVTFIASYAPSLTSFRGKLIEELISRGHKVSAIAHEASNNTREELDNMGVDYYDIPLNRRGINPFMDILWLFRTFKIIKKIRPDVVISYTIKPVIYGTIAAWMSKVPLIASIITGLGYSFGGETSSGKILNYITIKLYKLSARHNKLIFFQNPDNLNVFHQNKILGNETKAVIVNGSGVDINYFVPKPSPEDFCFLMIARLLVEKGVIEYFQAAEIIKKKYPHIRFTILGELGKGTSYIAEEELFSRHDEGIVEYLGVLRDVRPAIANCSVYVLPSYAEGTPRSVLEAMAMGRPIITSDAPGCRETVIDGSNGFLVPVGNAEALAEAMERFCLDSSLCGQMGPVSRLMAEDKYDVKKVNRVIMDNLGLR